MRNRLALLALAALVTLFGGRRAAADGAGPTPAGFIRADVAALASAVEADGGAELAYVSTAASLNIIRGRAWILTLAVGDAPAYEGEYFILSDIDGRLTGELLQAPGPDGTRVLVGQPLARFLERVELDAGPIRAAFERYFRGPAPGAGKPR